MCLTSAWHVTAQDLDEAILSKITTQAIAGRIAEIRMGNLVVKATPGDKVSIKQVRHEFLFGTAIPSQLAENSEDPMTAEEREKFLQILRENFNYAVHENALKWYATEKTRGQVDYSVADRIFEIAQSLDIPMRGHCIYWEKEEFLMDWLKELNNDELRLAVKNRAVSLVNHFKGRIDEFDLNNEMLHGDFFRRRLGYGIVSEMAWMVKAQNPNAKLYVNDYGIVDIGYNAGPYVNQIEHFLANGVPIEGIGIQAHRTVDGKIDNSSYMVQRNLDRFNKFNLPIKITEALFVYDDDETRAKELKRLFPIYFAHPKIEAIVMWGFWEKAHWIPRSAMWKTDFSPTLQAKAYRDLVFGEWWTEAEETADVKGQVQIRAFYGDYVVTVNGQSKQIKLSKSVGTATVTF
jgi:endo-1,4-beta-xylanase